MLSLTSGVPLLKLHTSPPIVFFSPGAFKWSIVCPFRRGTLYHYYFLLFPFIFPLHFPFLYKVRLVTLPVYLGT